MAPIVFGRAPDQFGFVVSDLDTGVDAYRMWFGMGPWSFYRYDAETLPVRRYRGVDEPYETRTAVLEGGGFSLVQPVRGRSTYADLLQERGPGLHHVAYRVANMTAALASFASSGWDEVLWGSGHGIDGDGSFAILDARDRLGCYLELIEAPRRRRPPMRTLPRP